MIKFATEFTIKRSEWIRGGETSRLLRTDGKKCCVGFYCLASGLTEGQILEKYVMACRYTSLSDLSDRAALHSDEALSQSDKMSLFGINGIYNINDDPRMRDQEREDRLTEKFAAADIKVTFVD